MKYAQGKASIRFKQLVKNKIQSAKTDQDLDKLLNDLHDAVLEARNNEDGLVAAIKLLEIAE